MDLVAACVRNPVKVAVGVILLLLFGGIALVRMPMQLTPEVQRPTITIETNWRGASPQEVEREIVQEQEDQLKGVEGVLKMSGECMDSMGRVTLEFVVGTDMNAALLRVNTRLQQVREYPEEADEPILRTSSSADQPIAWLILRPRQPTPGELRAFIAEHPDLAEPLAATLRASNAGQKQRRLEAAAKEHPAVAVLLPPDLRMQEFQRFAEDHIEARFERIDGVSNSNVLGGREEEMQIIVDPQRLADRRLTLEHVRAAVRARNRDTSAGDLWEGKRRYVIRTLGRFESPQQVEGLVLARHEGATVHLGDVAVVKRGFKKATGVVQNFGTTVLAINCVRDSSANVLAVMDGIYAATRELNEGILKERGLQLDQVYDETEYIYSAVGLVRQSIIVGGILTILVLLVFLRSARSTLVIALAIPTSVIGTFLLLGMMGRSLNVISLAGLAFAVGMLVDNAVVVLENIYRHYQQGEGRVEAAVKGTQEVWGAVVASTLTTLAVFLPILFIKEEAGQLFRDIALAISCSVGLSLIVSVTLIPTLTSRILSKHGGKAASDSALRRLVSKLFAPLDAVAGAFVGAVTRLHEWLQRGPWRQLAVSLLLVFGAILGSLALFPKMEYLPTGNRNLAFGIVLPPPGYNLDELVAMGQGIEQKLKPYWDTDPSDPAAALLDGPLIEHFFFVARGRSVFMGMRARDPLRAGELVPIIQRMGAGLPGTYVVAKQSSLFERGLTGGRTIEIEISGPELAGLVAVGQRVMGMVPGAVPNAQARPKPSLDLSNPEVHIRMKWEKAEDMGVTAADLGYTVNCLVDGAYAGDYYIGGDKIDLSIVGQPQFASHLQDLEDLPLATPSGDVVPLRAVADVLLTSGPEQINHRERQRAISIEVSPPEGMALEDALERIDRQILQPLTKEGVIGGAYRVTLSGTADKLSATGKALFWNIVLALVITYLLLAALFESWLYPFVIILSVPLGAVGGFLGLYVLNLFVPQALDVLTMIGFVILIGTVVNNAILIVHQSLVHIRQDGQSPAEAVLSAIRSRIRPIFMTVTTTVCGLLPLVLFPGAGSELYRGLGSVLIGGLLVSTIFTLLLVPTLFRLTLGARARLGRMAGRVAGRMSSRTTP